MRLRGVVALAAAALVAGCGGGGWMGLGKQSERPSDQADFITKPIGPGLVSRCPVPISYDDAMGKKMQEALDALPKDSVLRKAMLDYETERDNLRMCQ